MRRSTSILAMIVVLAWTSTAAAECAWVMWHHKVQAFSLEGRKLPNWLVMGGARSYEECEKFRVSRIRAGGPPSTIDFERLREGIKKREAVYRLEQKLEAIQNLDEPARAAEMKRWREARQKEMERRRDEGKREGVPAFKEQAERRMEKRIRTPVPDYGYVCLPDTIDPREKK